MRRAAWLLPGLICAMVSGPGPLATAGEPVLLAFHAEWCGPCREMEPALEALSAKGYPVQRIDIDAQPGLAERYNVSTIPAFVVLDGDGRERARTTGKQPAPQIAALFRDAVSPASRPIAPRNRPANANCMAATVRLHVPTGGARHYGSGTVVYSDQDVSLVLSCAHVFPRSGAGRPQVEVFGRSGNGHAAVWREFAAETLAVDRGLDLSLMAIRPGRALPACRIVPAVWSPEPGPGYRSQRMLAAGCPESAAPGWYETRITRPDGRGLSGQPRYRYVECALSPEQGQSGGGLFTTDHYLAGVCNFSDGRSGLFAHPAAVREFLAGQQLAALYSDPARPGYDRLVEAQAVQRRFGLFAGIAGRRNAIGFYAGGRPDATAAPSCQPPYNSGPAPAPILPPSSSASSSSSSTVVDLPPSPPAAPAVDLGPIYRRLNEQDAKIAKLADTPITFVTPNPDGTQAAQAVRLGESLGFKVPGAARYESRLAALEAAVFPPSPPSPPSK